MSCRIPPLYRSPDQEWKLALAVKQRIYQELGSCLQCSIGIVFMDLLACKDVNLSLFEDPVAKSRLAVTVDALNEKFGHVVDLLPIQERYGQVPERIPFGAPEVTLLPCPAGTEEKVYNEGRIRGQ